MSMFKPCKDCLLRPKAPGRSRCYPCYRKTRGITQHEPTRKARTLYIDIETFPNLGYVWGQWQQNLSLPQIVDFVEVACFGYKWAGDDEVTFVRENLVQVAWDLLNEADVVVHFYGSKFDIPHLNREFLQANLGPPSPYKQIDLKLAVAKRFKFTSNKLQHVSEAVGLAGKVSNEGWELWIKCMAGDAQAWADMEEYNLQDVVLLEELHNILLPWLPDAPHAYLYGGEEGSCPRCEGDLEPAGLARTKLSAFYQYKCLACGSFFRDSKRVMGVDIQDSVL